MRKGGMKAGLIQQTLFNQFVCLRNRPETKEEMRKERVDNSYIISFALFFLSLTPPPCIKEELIFKGCISLPRLYLAIS